MILPDAVEPEEGASIPDGMIEFTTKLEAVDRPVGKQEILSNGWMSDQEIEYITNLIRRINNILSSKLKETGLILADFKVEYDKGNIKSLDKDVFRKDAGFK